MMYVKRHVRMYLKLIRFKDGSFAVRKGIFVRRYADKWPDSEWWWKKDEPRYYKIDTLKQALTIYNQRCTKESIIRREVL